MRDAVDGMIDGMSVLESREVDDFVRRLSNREGNWLHDLNHPSNQAARKEAQVRLAVAARAFQAFTPEQKRAFVGRFAPRGLSFGVVAALVIGLGIDTSILG